MFYPSTLVPSYLNLDCLQLTLTPARSSFVLYVVPLICQTDTPAIKCTIACLPGIPKKGGSREHFKCLRYSTTCEESAGEQGCLLPSQGTLYMETYIRWVPRVGGYRYMFT